MYYYFEDYPDFKPSLSPREVIELGSFGGTYFRPIYSSVTGKNYKNEHRKFEFFNDIPDSMLTRSWDNYDKNINRYGVKVGSTLEEWEKKGWINPIDPYGWFQWYCNFYNGRRSIDDRRQIKRWKSVVNRFGKLKNKTPAIRQTLQHWGISS